MKCTCGKSFEINPLDKDGARTGPIKASVDEIETISLNFIDARTDQSFIIILECPFCGRMLFKKVPYVSLLDFPRPENLEEFNKIVGMTTTSASGAE